MSEDTENKESAPESVGPEKVETEPQDEEIVPVSETVVETTPEVIPEVPKIKGVRYLL